VVAVRHAHLWKLATWIWTESPKCLPAHESLHIIQIVCVFPNCYAAWVCHWEAAEQKRKGSTGGTMVRSHGQRCPKTESGILCRMTIDLWSGITCRWTCHYDRESVPPPPPPKPQVGYPSVGAPHLRSSQLLQSITSISIFFLLKSIVVYIQLRMKQDNESLLENHRCNPLRKRCYISDELRKDVKSLPHTYVSLQSVRSCLWTLDVQIHTAMELHSCYVTHVFFFLRSSVTMCGWWEYSAWWHLAKLSYTLHSVNYWP
jgi:hypothetical protein